MKYKKTSALLLNKALKRKQKKHSQYSQRTLARDLKVSSAYVSHLFKGRQLPHISRLDDLSHFLELDISEKAKLAQLIVFNSSEEVKHLILAKDSGVLNRKQIEETCDDVLSTWSIIALLEGLTLKSPYNQIQSLQQRLNLTSVQVQKNLDLLLKSNLIEKNENNYVKKSNHMYIPNGRSRQIFRNYHAEWIQKARDVLTTQTQSNDYERRLITGFTFALNTAKTDHLKKRIIDFLNDLSLEASAGDCSEVYQCNVQFFPVTKENK